MQSIDPVRESYLTSLAGEAPGKKGPLPCINYAPFMLARHAASPRFATLIRIVTHLYLHKQHRASLPLLRFDIYKVRIRLFAEQSCHIYFNALANHHDRRWFGAAESPCGSFETHSTSRAFGCQESLPEYMAGRCERDTMEQMAHVLDWRRGTYHQLSRANQFAPSTDCRSPAGAP